MNLRLLFSLGALASATLLAQEPQPLTSDELTKATTSLMAENAKLGALPLKLELSPDQAVGFKLGDIGAIVIPHKTSKPAKGARAGKQDRRAPMPIGQLWTSKLAPLDKDMALPNDKLRLVTVTADNKELELAVFALGIEKAGKKGFQLTMFGKDNSPVLRVPLTEDKVRRAPPIVMAARKTGETTGVLELKILGRFKAEIPVGKQGG